MSATSRTNKRLEALSANADRWGWPRAIANLIVKGAARYLGIHLYCVRVCAIPPDPEYPETMPGLEFRKIETTELLEASDDPELNMNRDFVEAAIRRGDHAFGAFDGSTLVSYIWRARKSAPDTDDVWIKVDAPYNYAYKSLTRKAYRGRRISPVLHLMSDHEMYKLGFRYRLGFVAITNYSSLATGKHIGSRIIGYAGYGAWFGRVFGFRSKAVKATGFEFFQPV